MPARQAVAIAHKQVRHQSRIRLSDRRACVGKRRILIALSSAPHPAISAAEPTGAKARSSSPNRASAPLGSSRRDCKHEAGKRRLAPGKRGRPFAAGAAIRPLGPQTAGVGQSGQRRSLAQHGPSWSESGGRGGVSNLGSGEQPIAEASDASTSGWPSARTRNVALCARTPAMPDGKGDSRTPSASRSSVCAQPGDVSRLGR